MNPIENVWGYLVCQLNKAHSAEGLALHARDANNADQLLALVQQKWEALRNDENYLQNLIESMPKRLQAVINAEGGWTQY